MLMIISKILIALIAIEHLYILWLEMFQWTGRAKKVFRGYPDKFYEDTKVMAANQGLYNGFLAAGLIWSLCIQNTEWSVYVALFFLGCVAVAGIYGAATVTKKILYVQAIPALVAIAVLITAMLNM